MGKCKQLVQIVISERHLCAIWIRNEDIAALDQACHHFFVVVGIKSWCHRGLSCYSCGIPLYNIYTCHTVKAATLTLTEFLRACLSLLDFASIFHSACLLSAFSALKISTLIQKKNSRVMQDSCLYVINNVMYGNVQIHFPMRLLSGF